MRHAGWTTAQPVRAEGVANISGMKSDPCVRERARKGLVEGGIEDQKVTLVFCAPANAMTLARI